MMKFAALVCLFGAIRINGEPVGTCPSTHGTYVDFLTHETDCTKFYKCNWGTPVLYDCPDGLHFNPTLNVCDWPAAAGCDGSAVATNKPTPELTTSAVEIIPSSPASGECTIVSCPDVPGVYPIFHPHPKDCGRYCKCDWGGVTHDMPCPEGLHFNPILDVCDWPANAGCGGSASSQTTTTIITPTTTTTSRPTTTIDPHINTDACDKVSCPSVPGLYPVFHSHPDDCGRYCECDWNGVAHDMICPEGLHFNPVLDVCDWPANGGCGGSVSSQTTTTIITSTTTTTSRPTTTIDPHINTDACDKVSCPSVPGLYPVFHSHPDDCGRYCKCDWGGVIHDMPCPEGLHFNPVLDVCDWPANAGCGGSALTTTTTSTTTTSSPTTTKPTTTIDPHINTDACAKVFCSSVPGIYPVFHQHPDDCGRYCECDWDGVAHDMVCPEGLHFNSVLDVCDWPAAAGCDGSTTTTTTTTTPKYTTITATPTTTTADYTTTTVEASPTSPTSGGCSSVSCPVVNGVYPVFHSHPKKCDSYCKCDWGVAYEMSCPPSLHFNPTLNVCDWSQDAGCPHA